MRFIPEVRVPAPKPPSYRALDMAFGVGAGAVLGDKSRYRSHGAITGASWAAGLHGYCLDFNPALPSYVEIPAAHTQLNFTAEDFSLTARIYIDSMPVAPQIFGRGKTNKDGYELFVYTDGRIVFYTDQAAANQQTLSAVGDIVVATWYTLGVSRAGASVRLYRNGVDVTATPGVHINPLTCARTAKIGIYDDLSGAPLDGKIEFLRIFRGIALAASEHLAWHNALA